MWCLAIVCYKCWRVCFGWCGGSTDRLTPPLLLWLNGRGEREATPLGRSQVLLELYSSGLGSARNRRVHIPQQVPVTQGDKWIVSDPTPRDGRRKLKWERKVSPGQRRHLMTQSGETKALLYTLYMAQSALIPVLNCTLLVSHTEK